MEEWQSEGSQPKFAELTVISAAHDTPPLFPQIEVKRVTKFRGSVFVNIADTYRSGADNLIPEKFCLMMAEIGFHRINAIPWVKTSNLARAAENRRLNPTWENLFHFVKTEAASLNLPEPERYFYKPFLYYPDDRKIKVGKIGGRQNRDGTMSASPKFVDSKLEEHF